MKSEFDIYLKKEETILWTGQPEKNISNKTHIFLLVISAIIAVFFALFWNIIVWTYNTPSIFKIFGILFLFYSTFGGIIHIILHRYRRSKTYYAISTERIYIKYLFFGNRIKSYSLISLPEPILKKYSNGIGSILINYEKPFSFKLFTFAIEYKWHDQYRRLEFLKSAQEVFNLIVERRNTFYKTD